MAKSTCSIPDCGRSVFGRGWCSMHWQRWKAHGDPTILLIRRVVRGHKVNRTAPTDERFRALSDQQGPMSVLGTHCIPWLGRVTDDGYGQFVVGQKKGEMRRVWVAHHFAWHLAGRTIAPGHHFDHLCHTLDPNCFAGIGCLHRRCVNADHLEVVDPVENIQRRHVRIPSVCRNRLHAMTDDNVYVSPRGRRICRACLRLKDARRRPRRRST